MFGSVDLAPAKISHQRLAATMNIERHKKAESMVAVKEATLLLAVDGIVGGVEVQCDCRGNSCLRSDEWADKNLRKLGKCLSHDAILKPTKR